MRECLCLSLGHCKLQKEHLRLLDLYDKVARYFIPTDERLLRPTMTLVDSNPYNIFLSREAFCAGASTLPQLLTGNTQPYSSTATLSHRPRPPFHRNSIANDGQDEAEFPKEKEFLCKAYHTLYFETDYDVVWASALSVDISPPAAQIMPTAAQTYWHAEYADLKKVLIRAARDWKKLLKGTQSKIQRGRGRTMSHGTLRKQGATTSKNKSV